MSKSVLWVPAQLSPAHLQLHSALYGRSGVAHTPPWLEIFCAHITVQPNTALGLACLQLFRYTSRRDAPRPQAEKHETYDMSYR